MFSDEMFRKSSFWYISLFEDTTFECLCCIALKNRRDELLAEKEIIHSTHYVKSETIASKWPAASKLKNFLIQILLREITMSHNSSADSSSIGKVYASREHDNITFFICINICDIKDTGRDMKWPTVIKKINFHWLVNKIDFSVLFVIPSAAVMLVKKYAGD